MADWTEAQGTWGADNDDTTAGEKLANVRKYIEGLMSSDSKPKNTAEEEMQAQQGGRTRTAAPDKPAVALSRDEQQRAAWGEPHESEMSLPEIMSKIQTASGQDRAHLLRQLGNWRNKQGKVVEAAVVGLKKKQDLAAKWREGQEKVAALSVKKKEDIDRQQNDLLSSKKTAYEAATLKINNLSNDISRVANEDPHRAVFSSIPGIIAMAIGSYVEARSGGKIKNTAFQIMQSRVNALAKQKLSRINSLRGKLSSEDRILKNMLSGISSDEEKLVLIEQALSEDIKRQLVPINEQYQLGLDKVDLKTLQDGVLAMDAEHAKQLVNMDPGYLKEARALIAAQTSWDKLKNPFGTQKAVAEAKGKDQVGHTRNKDFTKETKKVASQMSVLAQLTDEVTKFGDLDEGESSTFKKWLMGESVSNKAIEGVFAVLGDDKAFASYVRTKGYLNALAFEKAAETQGKRITRLDFEQTVARFAKPEQDPKDFFKALRSLGNEAGERWRSLYKTAVAAPIWTTMHRGHPLPERYSAEAKILENLSMPSGLGGMSDVTNKWIRAHFDLIPGNFPEETKYDLPLLGEMYPSPRKSYSE